jgi:hypothetical protein
MMRKHTPPHQEMTEQKHKDKSLCALFITDNKVLLLEDTKPKLLIKDDINDVLFMMEDTKYSARKEKS